MAQVKLLKISFTTGLPTEMDTTADDITLNSYTVDGGLVASSTGIDMNNTTISDADGVSFTDPTTDGLTQTAGVVAADDLMAKERENTMTTAGGIAFPTISDTAGEVDSMRVPTLAGAPTAVPTNGGEGHLVWDSTGNALYIWDGLAWDDTSIAEEAERLSNTYTADEALAANDALYISAADNVSKAAASNSTTSRLIGFAEAAAADTASVQVISEGLMGGFTLTTPGARQFLSTTAGALTETPPSGTGNVVVQAGYAKSTTHLQIHIEQLGQVA